MALLAVVGVVVLLALVSLGTVADRLGIADPTSPATLGAPSASASGLIGSAPSSAPSTSPSLPATASPEASSSASPSASATPLASPTPASVGVVPAAPTSADGFKLRATTIDLTFPIPRGTRVRYTNDFLIPRVGVTRRYNHARGVSASGRLLRAHDGIDVRAKLRTKLYAGFSGTVIDPAARWRPWDPERYGNVVVIVSDEAPTAGYAVLYAHLATTPLEVGDHVERGQLIGRLGQTGNAIGTVPHVHVELRAPFRIPVREGGRVRRIDAFDPYPSLVAADPRRDP
ncbi:MAG: peptidoglycan DD-metalloendopeptidase family protein [Candidatus Limnocylindrales bacterium]